MPVGAYINNLEKLKAGTLFRSVRKESSEPENIAVGQVSKELRFLQRQSQYASEIDRVVRELRLTCALIEACRTSEVPQDVKRQDLLAYYQGNFLNLVHQMKDKILQIVDLISEDEIPDNPSIEGDVSTSDLLRKKKKKLQAMGIEEAIKQWEQDNPTSKISVVLRKRLHHHHRVSGLRYDNDFLNLSFADIATQLQFQQSLTDYGKEQIEKLREESTERLFSGALAKARDTLKAIEENIEIIADALVIAYKLPISPEEAAEISNKQSAMLDSLKIVNRTAIEKIPEHYKALLDQLLEKIQKGYPGQVVAVYLVGSLGRGEHEEGYSDINVYIILDIDEVARTVREDDRFSLRVFTKKQFLAEECNKYRIIAKADGLILYGQDILKDEELPNAGLFLALTLNEDILDVLDNATKWVEKEGILISDIGQKSKRLAKNFIDFMYGVTMTNKPHYTASRRERLEKIIEMFPSNENVMKTLMSIARYGVGDKESFRNMIHGFRVSAEESLNKMIEVKKGIK